MIPLAVPNLCGKERENLNKCIDSTFVSTVGEFVSEFEKRIAEECEAPKSVCVNTGTSALHASLVGVGVKRDDLVILPSLTFIASANAIAYAGAEPWLVDIEMESWTLCPELLERILEEETVTKGSELFHKESGKRVSCIMPVYTLGCPANMDEINKVASRFNLPVIADGAASLGARYKGKNLAGLASATTFSFNGNKTITSGGGGAIISEDEELLAKIKHLTTTARVGMQYYHDEIGFNYRMTNLEAAVGCAQIENLKKFVLKKQEIRSFYNEAFLKVDGLSTFVDPEWADSSCWFSGVVIDKASDDEMTEIITKMGNSGIMARPFWMPIHLQPQFLNCLKTEMKNSNDIWKKILVLPCSTNIKYEELNKVKETFLTIYSDVIR